MYNNLTTKMFGHAYASAESAFNRYFLLFLLVAIAANMMALFSPVMDQDSALYAGISKQIVLSGDWVNLMMNGTDWLDKPHLPFWLTALFFKLFGISAFAYKLPSFLCWMAGVWFTYRLAKTLYGKTTAQVATLIFATSLHVLLANYDVRAEGYLTTFIVAALFYLFRLQKEKRWMDVIWAALFCAMAIQTKGIFVLITVAAGFVIYWLLTRQWSYFYNIRWWSVLLLTAVFILPELYCLYMQFDLHPEKVVFGNRHVSGIRFFFWDSQFGRFFNTGPIKGHGDLSFFIHTTLWAFLPWSAVLLVAVVSACRTIRRHAVGEKIILTGSALVTFLIFSVSRFQLPHYIVILFPHFAIFSAAWLLQIRKNSVWRNVTIAAWSLYAILLAAIIVLLVVFRFDHPWPMIVLAVIITAALPLFGYKDKLVAFVWQGICFALLASCFLHQFIYSELMKYNAGKNAAEWINSQPGKENAVMLDALNYSFDFYLKGQTRCLPELEAGQIEQGGSVLVFCPEGALQKLQLPGIQTKVLKEFDYYRITMLKGGFLNQQTRPSLLERYVVVRCSRM